MDILDKDVFVNTMLNKVKSLDDEALFDFFSNLNGNKEKLFSNIYDAVFINKLCTINKAALNSLLSLFLIKEEDDLVNPWIVDQIIDEIPDVENVVVSLQKLNIAQTTSENFGIKFENEDKDDYLTLQSFDIIQNSQKTLFELFATESGTQELAKNEIKSFLSSKLIDKDLHSFNYLLENLKVLEYNINNKNIVVEVNNVVERFIYGIMRDQIKPLKLENNPNKIITDLIMNLNKFIAEKYSIKNGETLLELVDIDLIEKNIFVKWNDVITKDISKQNEIMEEIKTSNDVLDEEQNYLIKDMTTKSIDVSYLQILQQYFLKFLRESKISSQYHTLATVKDFSFLQNSLYLAVPNEAVYIAFDEQLASSDLAKNKKNLYFPDMQFFYRIEPSKDQNNEITSEKIVNNKSKIVNSSVSLSVDKTKDLDTFYALDENSVQNIVTLLDDGKNIAIVGDRGLGKTHLVNALANHCSSTKKILYTTGDKFCNEYWALGKKAKNTNKGEFYKHMNSFLDGFDGVDILIIDGIESLGGAGKTNTQDVLKKIVLKNSDMSLVFTSRGAFKNIPWNKKKVTLDKTTYSESSSIFDEIYGLNLILLPKTKEINKQKIVQNQWQEFLNKKNNLFLSKELPEGIVNLLSRKVNPSLYEQIFESINLNISQDYSISGISEIIQNFISEKVNPEPEEIIDIIIDSILDGGNNLSKNMSDLLLNMNIDIRLWDKKELKQRLHGTIKSDSFEGLILRLAIFYIKQVYPKKSFTDISMYFNGRSNCGALYNEARDWIMTCKEIDISVNENIENYILETYGINL